MNSRFRVLRWVAVSLGVIFAGAQLFRPSLPTPPVAAELQAPPEVKEILRNSCYNCHSNETKLSWFDWPVPAYWLVAHDVKSARARLNFSEIGKLPVAAQRAALYESVNMIQLGAMPLAPYQKLHPQSGVTPAQLDTLRNYLSLSDPPQKTPDAEVQKANAEYEAWLHAGSSAQNVADAPNGMAFLPDYKNWKTISSTERFDNHSVREILGNDIAVRAIAENRINPWPDGTAFAKVAWHLEYDDTGTARTGAFYQVEFMIRDSHKYASTKGWGWARWRGMDLKPYGRNASFTDECVVCHLPVAKNDYVYTVPLEGQQ